MQAGFCGNYLKFNQESSSGQRENRDRRYSPRTASAADPVIPADADAASGLGNSGTDSIVWMREEAKFCVKFKLLRRAAGRADIFRQLFMHRPAYGNQLLAQHAGRAAIRRKTASCPITGPHMEINCWRSMRPVPGAACLYTKFSDSYRDSEGLFRKKEMETWVIY